MTIKQNAYLFNWIFYPFKWMKLRRMSRRHYRNPNNLLGYAVIRVNPETGKKYWQSTDCATNEIQTYDTDSPMIIPPMFDESIRIELWRK